MQLISRAFLIIFILSIFQTVQSRENVEQENGGVGEAIAATTSSLLNLHTDSVQIEVGSGLYYDEKVLAPTLSLRSRLFFQQKYTVSFALNYHPQNSQNRADLIYGGIGLGKKGFSTGIGKYYIEALIGAGGIDGERRIVFEPSLLFPIAELKPIKTFFLRHRFGINAALAYTHLIDPNNASHIDDMNTVKLSVNLYANQRNK